MQDPWAYNTAPCNECCAGIVAGCRYYFPCFIRNMIFQYAAIVAEDDGFGAPDLANLSTAIVKRMTVTNNDTYEESADWSAFQEIDSDSAGGQVDIDFLGLLDQGCTFGITILTEHWVTGLGFKVKITLCNPNDHTIWVEPRHGGVSFSLSYEDVNKGCTAVLNTAQPAFTQILAGDDHEFVLDFSPPPDPTACYGTCLDPTSLVIEEPETFFGALPNWNTPWGFTAVCRKILTNLLDVVHVPHTKPLHPDCLDPPCPPGGCILDTYPIANPTADCACGCGSGSTESMSNCDPPKEQLIGSNSKNGSIQICESRNDGFGTGRQIVEVWNSDCKKVASIIRPTLTSSFTFQLHAPPGGTPKSVSVDLDFEPDYTVPHCTGYIINWGYAGNTLWLEVDGFREEQALTGYTAITPDGTAYALAQNSTIAGIAGVTYSMDAGGGGMQQDDEEDMDFFDDVVMEFA